MISQIQLWLDILANCPKDDTYLVSSNGDQQRSIDSGFIKHISKSLNINISLLIKAIAFNLYL
ncbi:MAG TPA: hypothetical protein V6C71_11595 [Coleofasciculaceae cyanobacterium]